MTFDYQNSNSYFAQIAGSIERLGADELTQLGATNVRPAFRGAYFNADRETLYRINYCSRLITRVLAPLVSFACPDDAALYENGKNIPWEDLFGIDDTFAIFANTVHSTITHSQYASLKLKDALCDRFREKFEDKRPSVDRDNPTVWLNLHIQNNQATVSLDVSGGSLHKRGYRAFGVEAPLQETLGAAIVQISGWDMKRPFIDPFCGSGTLLAEAHMRACSIPAGYLRKSWGFMQLPDYDEALWLQVKAAADAKIRQTDIAIIGSDIDKSAVDSARRNFKALPFGDTVKIDKRDFRYVEHIRNGLVVANLPYGIRLEPEGGIDKFYAEVGAFFRRAQCRPCKVVLYIGDRNDSQYFGMAAGSYVPLVNGDIQGCLVTYDIAEKNEYEEGKERQPRFDDRRDHHSSHSHHHDRGDRPSYNRDREDRPSFRKDFGDRPSFNRDREDRPSFRKDHGDRPSFNRDREDRPSFRKDFGDRPSFNRDRDDRPSFRKDHGDRPSFNRDREDRPSFRKDFGDRPSFNRDREDRPSFRKDHGDRPSYNRDREDRPSFRKDFGDRPSFNRDREDRPSFRKDHGDRPSFNRDREDRPTFRKDHGDRPSFNRDREDRPTFRKDHGDRPSFNRDREDRPSFHKDHGDRPSFNRDREDRPSFRKDFGSRPPLGHDRNRDDRPSFKKDFGDRPTFRKDHHDRDDRGGSDRSGPRFRGH